MNKLIPILVLATLACGMQLPTAPALRAIPAPVPLSSYPVEITGDVWLRDSDNIRTGVLEQGTIVWVICRDSWCYIYGGEYKFFQGCSTYNPDGLGCQSE